MALAFTMSKPLTRHTQESRRVAVIVVRAKVSRSSRLIGMRTESKQICYRAVYRCWCECPPRVEILKTSYGPMLKWAIHDARD